MTEKVEWEIVDPPAESSQEKASRETRPTMRQLMKKLLGPWWKLKLVSVASITSLLLVLFAALVGTFVLMLSAGALIATGVAKLRQKLRDHRREVSL